MDLKEIEILGDQVDSHWYYRSKAKALTTLLGSAPISSVLDIGAGSGFFAKYLLTEGRAREAWCVDISYDADSDMTLAGRPLHFRRAIGNSDSDVALAMDVLEHVDDDVGLLSEYVGKVRSGTRFVISVPAFRFLWSAHDVFLDHRRRYRVHEIDAVAGRAGLRVNRGCYFFGSVFPLAAAIRLTENALGDRRREPRSQLGRHHPAVNETLAALCSAELPLMKHNRLFGLSAFCLATKP